QADLQSLTAGNLDPLRVGFFGRGLGALIPGICVRLERELPDIVIRVVTGKHDEELLGMARRGEVDATFVQLPLADATFELVTLDCGLPPRRIGLAWSTMRGESGATHAFVTAATAEAERFTRKRLSLAS